MIATLFTALWLLVTPAMAQEAPPPDPASEAESEAAARYRLGLDLMGQGKYADACGVFSQIDSESSYADKAEEQMRLGALGGGGAACEPSAQTSTGRGLTRRRRTDSGLLELTISQGLVGPALLGIFVPLSLNVQEPAVYLAGGLVGLTLGIGTPLWIAKRHHISEGQAMAVGAGEFLGGFNGFFIAGAADMWDDAQGMFGVMTGGLVTGLGVGIGTAVGLDPRPGAVSSIRSGFTWGMYFSGISFLAWPEADTSKAVFLRLLIGSDLGALAGVLIASQTRISRPRMNVINLAGYAGALGLGLLYGIVALAAEESVGAVWFTVLGVGAAGGLTAGVFLSKDMKSDAMAFLGRGSMLGTEDGKVVLGMPSISPRVVKDGKTGIDVRLAHGRF